MKGIALGCWQREIFGELVRGREIPHPIYALRGRAKDYRGRYEESLRNLFARMRGAGYAIEWIPGVRGGEPTSKFRLV